MILLIVIISITCIALYFLETLDDNHSLIDTLAWVITVGICAIPTLLTFIAFDYFGAPDKLNGLAALFVPLLTFASIAIWATWGKPKNNKSHGNKHKKDDFTAEAIILTTVLSENDSSNNSESSNSSSSSSSQSSSSNSDDFFLL